MAQAKSIRELINSGDAASNASSISWEDAYQAVPEEVDDCLEGSGAGQACTSERAVQ